MRSVATISVAHNYIRIFGFYGEFLATVIKPFCKAELTRFGLQAIPGTRKKIRVPTHVFAKSNNEKTEYRMPSSMLKEFLDFAEYRGYNKARVVMLEEPEITGHDVTFNIQPEYQTPRPDQKEWIDYQLGPGPLKVNNQNTGGGKTYMSLFSMAKISKRTLVTIQPRYITTWENDIAKMMQVEPKDVLKWEFADLPRLAQLCREGTIDPKIIILPTTRITAYLKQCKLDPSLPSLDQIIADINPGLRIIDESHESFHEVCMSLLYGNLSKFFLLSATLKGDDPFMNRMYKAVAPTSVWLKEPDPENYIDIVAWLYSINTRKHRVSTMQFGSYSDIAFEKSILRNPKLLDFYFELADEMYRTFYLDIKEEGTKCLLFFTLIEMCQYMVKRFRERYPGEDFDSFLGTLDKKTPTKYLEHENLVTTPGSTGTGKDIPGSVTLLCFHTVFSIQRNKQIIGRLRQLFGKFGGRITPRFVFPVCVDIPKHGECFKKRKLALAGKQKTWRTMQSNLEAA